jgi:proline iminopeptidase
MKSLGFWGKSLGLLFAVLFSMNTSADQVDGLYAMAYGNPKNQPLLFLHGGPGYNSYTFEFSNADALGKRGYYVVVFDQRGCARSAKAPLSTYTFANAVADVHKIVSFYHLKNPIILGHSYGGTLAIKYAQAFPNSYKALMLIDSPLDQEEMVLNILNRTEEFYLLRKDAANAADIQSLRLSIFTEAGYVINPDLASRLFAHAIKCDLHNPKSSNPHRDALWKALNNSANANLVTDNQWDPFAGMMLNDGWVKGSVIPDLKKLGAKAFGIFGADDGLFSAHQLKEIEAALPKQHFDLTVDASHNLFIDRQDEFFDFLERISKGLIPGQSSEAIQPPDVAHKQVGAMTLTHQIRLKLREATLRD